MSKLLVVYHPGIMSVHQRLYAHLQRVTGWDLTLLVPATWSHEFGTLAAGARDPSFGGKLRPVPVWLRGSVPLHTYRSTFVRVLFEERPDVIYLHHEPYGMATAQMYAANRLTLRRPIGFYTSQNVFKRYPFPFSSFERSVFRQSSFAVAVTSEVLSVLRRRGYQGPADIIPLFPIDLDQFRPTPEAQQLAGDLRHHPDELLVGFVGRFVEEKGLPALLRALALLTDLPWRLVLAGAGPYEPTLEALAEELRITERVTKLGYVPHEQAATCLGALDVLVLPSETRPHWKEQFGRVLIEAVACGTPVIGSSSGAIPEVVESVGAGLIFPEGNVKALAVKLRDLLEDSDKRRQIAAAACGRIANLYSQEALAGKLAAVIEGAMFRKPRCGATSAQRTVG